MADPAEQPVLLLDRASRATRGKRMTNLLDGEIEEDEQFWNQEALKEEEHDTNYVEEGEAVDEFDSDFDEDESDPEDDGENDPEERVKSKKRLIFPGKPSTKKKTKKKDLVKLKQVAEDLKSAEPHEFKQPEKQEASEESGEERVVRKSTRTSVIVRQAEREAIRAALQATTKPVKRKKEGEERRMTQEEMLLEAGETEIMNLRSLARVLAREEEVKKKAIVHKAVYTGPQLRYSSKDGKTILEFSKGLTFDSEIDTSPAPYPKKALCVVTGLPAKYRDPKTGLPYATMDAFRVLRERFLKEENDRLKQQNMDMGPLFCSLGQACPSKQKRSVKTRSSALRLGVRFRQISALESNALE